MPAALAAITALLVIATTVAGRGQSGAALPPPVFTPTPPGTQADTPTFRSSAEGVALDAFVTDASGEPVRGLTRDDFEIFENGKPQPITTFEAVDLPIVTPADAWPLAEPDVASNQEPEGRVYVIALAAYDPCQALRIRKFLRDFLEHQFGPNDVAAVVSLLTGLATDGQDFTNNRRLLLNAVDKFSGDFQSFNDETCDADPHGSRGRNLVASFKDLVEVLGRMPGRHKSLLYFNEGPGFKWGDLEDYQGGVGTLEFDDAHRAMTIATRSNVTIYPIAPQGVTTAMGRIEDRMDFRTLATMTGGLSHINSNDFAGAFERIVRDASVHYMLGFNSAYNKRNGKFVRLEVRVRRPGMTVRTRNGYVNATERERRAEERERVVRGPVSEALASPLATAGHPLRLTAAAFKGTRDRANVVLTLETAALLDGGTAGIESRRGRVEIRYVATDAKRRLYPEIRHIGTLSISSREADESAGQLRILSQLELPEGRYQIRMAAGGALGAGSLVYDFEVPDFNAERLTMSSVSLTTVSAARLPTLHAARIPPGKTRSCYNGDACKTTKAVDVALAAWSPDTATQEDPLYKALPTPPTTARAFASTETLALFAEVYPSSKAGDAPVGVAAELRRADQSAVRRVSRELSQNDRRRSGGYGVTLTLPLSAVEPGRYLLHVEARSTADNQTTARDIPLDIIR